MVLLIKNLWTSLSFHLEEAGIEPTKENIDSPAKLAKEVY